MRAWLLSMLAVGTLACLKLEPAFHCEGDSTCGPGGRCEPTGFCSFEAPECARSGRRYGAYSAPSIEGACVDGEIGLLQRFDGGAEGGRPPIDAASASAIDAQPVPPDADPCRSDAAQVPLSVVAIDLDGRDPSPHIYTEISAGGTLVHSDFTPFSHPLDRGLYTVTISNYQNYLFDHWEDLGRTRSRSVDVRCATELRAYYYTGSDAGVP